MPQIKLLIDSSPLGNANAHRGIGAYTRLLTMELEKSSKIDLRKSTTGYEKDFKADLVHYPYFDLFFSTLPLIHKAPKQVVTIHDVIPLKFPEVYDPGLRGSLKFTKQKFALSKIDAIITDSKASKNDIAVELGVDENKIHVVYLAANPLLQAQDQSSINRARREYKLPQNYLLYVGDINYNKNLPQLIKALKYLPNNLKLVMLGKNFYPQEIREWQWIAAQIEMSEVENRIKFLTNVNKIEDLAAIYSGAVCYVQPSIYEGFGLPVLEAMQCKTPVIASKNSSLVEIGGEAALLVDSNAESFSEAINEVLNWSKSKREQKIREAFKWSQTFSWKKTAEQTIKVYEEVLS